MSLADDNNASQGAGTTVAEPSQAESTPASEEGAGGSGEAKEPTVEQLQGQVAELTTRVEGAEKSASAKQSEYDQLIAAHNREIRDVEATRLAEAETVRDAETRQLAEDDPTSELSQRTIQNLDAKQRAKADDVAREEGQKSGNNTATANLWTELRNSPPFKDKSEEWVQERYNEAVKANGLDLSTEQRPSIPMMATVMTEALMTEATASSSDLEERLKALEGDRVGAKVEEAKGPESPPSSQPATDDDKFLEDYGDQKSDDHARAQKILEAREAVNLK